MNTLTQYTIDFLTAQSLHLLILFVLVLAATIALRHKSAHLRYLLWLLIVAKCLVPPLHTISLAVLPDSDGGVSLTPAASEIAENDVAAPLPQPALLDLPPAPVLMTRPTMPVAQPKTATPSVPAPTPTLEPIPAIATAAPSLAERLAEMSPQQWIPTLWLGGAAVYFLMIAVKALRFHRYIRSRRTLLTSQSHPAWAGFLSAALPEAKPVRVYQLAQSGQPFVWGLLRGAVYLPENFAAVNDSEKQQSILMHEAGHILRFDPLINFLQVVAQGLFWFHPMVWIANRRIRAEREKCCDEFAVATLNTAPRHYCTAIVETLMAAQPARPAIPTLAVAGPVKNIEDRIKTLLAPGKTFRTRPTAAAIISILLLAAIVVPTTIALTHKVTPPDYTLSGKVVYTDGKPIAGAIVFDDGYGPQPYQKGITDADGTFHYQSWNEEHLITATAEGFTPQTITFTTWPFDNSKQLNFTLQRATEGDFTALPNGASEAILLPEHFKSSTVLSLKTGQFLPEEQAIETNEPYLSYGYTFPPGAHPSRYSVSTIPQRYIGVSTGPMSLGEGAFLPESKTIRTALWSIQHRENFPDFKMSRMSRDVYNDIARFPSGGYFIHPHIDTSWPYITAFKGDDGTLGVFEITKVENRNIYIRFKTLTAKTDQEPQQNTEFAAVLPNGVTVELLGVCDHPSDGRQWWRPDGSFLEQSPYEKMPTSHISPRPGRKAMEAAVKISGVENGIGFRYEIVGTQSSGSCGTGNQTIYAVSFDQPETADRTDARVGIAAGPWQTTATQKADFSGVYSSGAVIWHSPTEKNGRAVLHIAHKEMDNNIRVVAIEHNGKEHTGGSTSAQKEGLESIQITFNLPLSKIKEFQFQTRPYEWVTFKNISLRPGVKTKVEIEAQKTGVGSQESESGDQRPAVSFRSSGAKTISQASGRKCHLYTDRT